MSIDVEIFRGDDYHQDGRVPLLPLLRHVFEPMVKEPLDGALFELEFLPPADRRPVPGRPSVINLRSSHGYVRVRIVRAGAVLYQHPHTVREVVGRPLQRLLGRRQPTETHWGFGIRGSGMEKVALVRPSPNPEHTMEIAVGRLRTAAFHVEELPDPEPPESTPALLGVAGARLPGPRLGVVWHQRVHGMLARHRRFSREVEEGGFLAGHVHRNRDVTGGHLVEITAAIPAERTGASLLHFTFTGESYLRISEVLAARPGRETLIGWYHTHLFPAGKGFGLSSADVDLHTTTFRRPWQVAALVNLGPGSRVLRTYRACTPGEKGTGHKMTTAVEWTAAS